ncbi:MAG: ABC transporter permease subunit [Chloroflexota bacterium]
MDNPRPVNKVLLIMRKEWMEIIQQRALVLTMILPPLLFALIPVGALFAIGTFAGMADTKDIKDLADTLSKLNPALANMNEIELAQAIIGQQLATLFFLMPVILPSVISSYSVVGEKTSQTLEPLLATPVKTWELLLAKCLAALVPSVVLTWLSAALFAGGLALVAASPAVFTKIINAGWLLVLFLCAPLLALITIALTIAVSARANDPRTAQQISAVLILPIMLVFLGQITGLLVLSPFVALLGAVVLALLAALALWFTGRLFQRETILTRWS